MTRERQMTRSFVASRSRRAPRTLAALAAAALGLPLLAGCNLRQVLGLDMYNQPKVQKPYRPSDFFEDGQSNRALVAGTIPRGGDPIWDRSGHAVQRAMYTGDGFPEEVVPSEPDALRSVLERGQTVFNVYCSVCHGQTGHGDGMIVQRGFTKPPSFVLPSEQAERDAMSKKDPYRFARTTYLQSAPPRHIYDVISNGFGGMYSYGERVAPDDRWKVAAYVKTLQAAKPRGVQIPPSGTVEPHAAERKAQ